MARSLAGNEMLSQESCGFESRGFRMKTTTQQIEQMKLELILLQADLEAYLNGDWRYEYYMTIGYNKVFTGRKVYKYEIQSR